MEFFKQLILNFSVVDAIDILLITFVFYYIFLLMKTNNAGKVVGYVLVALLIGSLAVYFKLPVMSQTFKMIFLIVVLFFAIIYSSEIKREMWKRNNRAALEKTSDKYDCTDEELEYSIDEIIKAVQNMAKKDIGALIVMVTETMPSGIVESGTMLNSLVSAQLLECIFNPKTPLHDGAVLIKGNRILAAGCFLPLSQELNLPKDFGTRHRAGIGISEANNVMSIVVSEETGIISLCQSGKIKRYVDSNILKEGLESVYGLTDHQGKHIIKWSAKKK